MSDYHDCYNEVEVKLRNGDTIMRYIPKKKVMESIIMGKEYVLIAYDKSTDTYPETYPLNSYEHPCIKEKFYTLEDALSFIRKYRDDKIIRCLVDGKPTLASTFENYDEFYLKNNE